MRDPKSLSECEIAVISELIEIAQVFAGGNEVAKACGAVIAERAACILSGRSKGLHIWSIEDILKFSELWEVDIPAGFAE